MNPASHFPTQRNAHPPKSSYLENKQECDVNYTIRQRKGGSTKFERKIQSASDGRKIPKQITCLFQIKWRARECILLRNLTVRYLDQQFTGLHRKSGRNLLTTWYRIVQKVISIQLFKNFDETASVVQWSEWRYRSQR
jgi:hypothetical protein